MDVDEAREHESVFSIGGRLRRGFLVALIVLAVGGAEAAAGDWPQWRFCAGRGAATPDELPADLHLQWVRCLPAPRPAWPESQPSLRFDVSYCPVAAGKQLLVPSMVTDGVTAYDTETGAEKWQFTTDGPVRLAPIADQGRVWFGSDDGYLYCVTADEGRLVWRVRGGSSDRKVLGNERLISTWPIRGGPVLYDGTIYFTAGIWPFMGIFIHAVDAQSGEPVWTNSGDSCPYVVQPHKSPAFSGFVPRGHLAATPSGLVIPGGRTPPACYDLKTGRQLHWQWMNKGGGTYHVTAHGDWYFAGGFLWSMADGKTVTPAVAMVHDDQAAYSLIGNVLAAEAVVPEEQVALEKDRKGRTATTTRWLLKPLWKRPVPESCGRLYLKAGSRFFAGKLGQVTALEVRPETESATVVWQAPIEGSPWAVLAADDKLFVVTEEGRIYCFGSKAGKATVYQQPATAAAEASIPAEADSGEPHAQVCIRVAGGEGYAVFLGLGSGRLVEKLARGSNLDIIAIDRDEQKVADFRRRMIGAGLYGARVAAHVGDPIGYPLPPYCASLVVCDERETARLAGPEPLAAMLRRVLRPYGGAAYLPMEGERLQALLQTGDLAGYQPRPLGDGATMLVRSGPLPGAADWTHQYADAANTVVSQDERVKAPLGLLWFGGPSHDGVLPRHGHGPAPQVAAGRLFIEGPDMLRALDIYTGRLLWQTELTGLGKFYDKTSHQPGAGEIGSNYVSTADSIYVAYGKAILRLDAATGQRLPEFRIESTPENPEPHWGYVGVCQDVLMATSTPVAMIVENDAIDGHDAPTIGDWMNPVEYASASRRLAAMGRQTGRILWSREATYSFRHNNIAAAAEKVFVIDGLPAEKQQQLQRRGADPKDFPSRLVALDLHTGRELWSTTEDVFGTFLSYSAEHDVLLQAGSAGRDRASDEAATGMIAYRGADGGVLWKALDRRHSGPCMLHGDTLMTQSTAYSLLTGEPILRQHPLTGEPIPWTFKRNYGCNTVVGSRYLLTFRSAAAGFFDLARDGGTGNFGGFKSSCTSNLVAAGGLLNAPEYTRTCACNYQNQTSLAMIHDPHVEMWTFNDLPWDGKPVRRVGINFGAPGDRRADDGTLWLDWPSTGGPSPDLPLEIDPEGAESFRHHSSLVTVKPGSGGLAWVAASGIRGIRRISLTLAKEPSDPRAYTIRLHFLEPEKVDPGQRVFSLRLQGEEVLAGLDIAKEAGRMTAMVKEFRGIRVADKLEIELLPAEGGTSAGPVLCGLEAVAE